MSVKKLLTDWVCFLCMCRYCMCWHCVACHLCNAPQYKFYSSDISLRFQPWVLFSIKHSLSNTYILKVVVEQGHYQKSHIKSALDTVQALKLSGFYYHDHKQHTLLSASRSLLGAEKLI